MIRYNGPIEAEIQSPSLEYIRDIIFNKSEKYWKQGGGDSCIEIDEVEERLIFFYDEPYGFFVMRHPDYLVPIDRNISIKTVEHMVGGEPMRIPTCSYISREKAFEIINNFMNNKSIEESVEWIDLYEIEFDHGFNE
ncbi:hypothetical protein [Clostridium felsineum]|uniref:Uncharacterized protein n=1 Tax=Clostridium felsineum TaxID=36839 RepID=A0A1S8L1B6_9CLOT|nr:hypothetical protein [Clostridium felsineum]URZ08854.1 hypothetical protein CLROS_042480 [Clostridium felsineum]URZ09482.1 hypothetical protein CROST_001530 [Clostridium felsineum]